MTEYQNNNFLSSFEEHHHFSSGIYLVEKPEFLKTVFEVSQEYIDKSKKKNDVNKIYPVAVSENFVGDDRLIDFKSFIAEASWEILKSQGYNMNFYETFLTELWCQEHHQTSNYEEHIHSHFQLSGFYFLNVPENSQRVLFHDPRPAKVYSNLIEFDSNLPTYASSMINYTPKNGLLMFTNAWLPHAFTRNPSEEPTSIVHFLVTTKYVGPKEGTQVPEVEII